MARSAMTLRAGDGSGLAAAWVLAAALGLAGPAGAEGGHEHHAPAPAPAGDLAPDAADMGGAAAAPGAAWEAADRQERAAFERAYDSARDERAVFETWLGILGPQALLDFVELRYEQCHHQAHELGKAIYARSGDVGRALQICGNRCTNACMHGVVGEAFGRRSPEEIRAAMSGFCYEGEMAELHKVGNCAHAIGHALMIRNDHEIGPSLEACTGFARQGLDYYCATGVYMEYQGLMREKKARGEAEPRPSVHFPCDVHTRFSPACYRYNLVDLHFAVGAAESKVVAECLALPQPRRRGCFHGVGAIYSHRIAKRPAMIRELCLAGGPEDRILCVEGAVEKLGDFDEALALEVCAELEGELVDVCRAAAREKMYRLDKPSMALYRE